MGSKRPELLKNSAALAEVTEQGLILAQAADMEVSTAIDSLAGIMNQFNLENIIPTKVGYQYWFADKDFLEGRTLKMSVVAPHKSTHAPHQHIEDEFFFVVEGTAEFYLDGKTTVAGAYTSFYCPSWMEHGIKNVGDTELKYLVIKKYQKK